MGAILIPGGLGVIGAWVTRELVDQGQQVVTYSRHIDKTLVSDIFNKIECVVGDINDFPMLMNTVKRYDVDRIVHLSAILPHEAEANPYLGVKVNAEGSINVLEVARLMNVKRLVFTSSKAVYAVTEGDYGHPNYKPMDENYTKAPTSVYGTTKLFIENLGIDYNRIYGLDFVALRFPSPYGVGRQARHGILAITSKVIESAMLGKPLAIPQGGEQKDDFTYVRDIAHGIVLALFADKLQHRIFNIGTGVGDTIVHMIEILNDILGEVPITIGPGLDFLERASNMRYSVFNIERACKELGFSPQFDLEAGIKDYMETMKRLGIPPV